MVNLSGSKRRQIWVFSRSSAEPTISTISLTMAPGWTQFHRFLNCLRLETVMLPKWMVAVCIYIEGFYIFSPLFSLPAKISSELHQGAGESGHATLLLPARRRPWELMTRHKCRTHLFGCIMDLLGFKWFMKLHLQKELCLYKACWYTGLSMEMLERAAIFYRI